jgi:hypothetical protein
VRTSEVKLFQRENFRRYHRPRGRLKSLNNAD